VTAINITFDNITVHRAGDGDADGEWIVVAEDLDKTVDLLQLSGIGDLLGKMRSRPEVHADPRWSGEGGGRH